MPHAYRFGRFELLPLQRSALADGQPLALGARALDVLLALVQRGGELISKEELLQCVWPGLVVEEANVHVQISLLRKALGARAIATVAGLGYRFALPITEISGMPPHNLPAARTPFIGRVAALAEAEQRLHSTRVLTFIGIGGSGKTRLALRLAERLLPAFAQGVWFVDLAPLEDAAEVPIALARTLGVAQGTDTTLEQGLLDKLRSHRALLVFDNCEHLLDAVAALAGVLLGGAPELKIMCTSREALGLPGEIIYAVRPLALPAADADGAGIAAAESVQLFIDRACAAAPGLVFDADSGPVAARICRRLDGIPLAIELAAARMKMLSMAQVSERLDERFRLLTGGARALPRQQTLRAVIQWSFEHLGPAEQRLLRALSACSGGCDLAAAVALQGDAADEMATLDSLARLVDKSLLTVERHAQNVRYAMLETVRQYALERLGDSGELLAVRHRHLDHFLTVAEQMGCQPTGDAVQTVWVRLAPEGDNLTRALAWCSGAEGAQRGLRMVHALRNYWPSQGLLVTGYQATTEALAHPGAQQRDLWRCKALAAAAHLCCLLGGPQEHAHAEELLAIATEIADEPYQARALWHLAKIRAELGDMEGARRCGEESLTLARSSGDEVEALNSLGGLAFQAKACGAHDQAQRLWEESLAMSQRVNHRIGQAIALVNLASIAIDRRRADSARTSLIQARDVIARVESSQLDQYLVETAAALAALTDDFDLAVKLHRASARRRAELAISPQVLSCEQADDLDRARNALDPEGCAAMDAVAAQISHKQVLAEVSAWLNRWPPAHAVTEPGH